VNAVMNLRVLAPRSYLVNLVSVLEADVEYKGLDLFLIFCYCLYLHTFPNSS
jgi:hypothetical protein